MGKTDLQIYFVISTRDGESENMKGISVVSIQNFKKSSGLTMPQKITDPETGKKVTIENPLPGMNYNTEVSYVDGFLNEATIKITRKTRSGDESHEFRINDKKCYTYMDENYIVKFGIAEFELEEYYPEEERNNVTRRNVERIRQLALADAQVNVLATKETTTTEAELEQ